MQTVLTAYQVKRITNGRTPHLPVEYEEACRALQACASIDEGKYWSDKADALAAWAKIYRDDTAARHAKILKLRAFRRMGELAREIARSSPRYRKGSDTPTIPASKALRDAGLKESEVAAAKCLSLASPEQMRNLETKKVIPTIHSARGVLQGRGESEPARYLLRALTDLAEWSRRVSPGTFREYVGLRQHKQAKWKQSAEDAAEWLSLLLGKEC